MADVKNENSVTLVTWRPLWFYWPAYVALARVLNGASYSSIKLKVSSEFKTDKQIRDAFYQQVRNGDNVLAICEPDELMVPGEPGQNGVMNLTVQRIPISSRLPHWLYRNKASTNFDIATLPEDTTSGDYIRRVAAALPRFMQTPTSFSSTSGSLLDEYAKLKQMKNGEFHGYLASYTPWHVADRDLIDDTFDNIGLPGPRQDVTSLLYVREEGTKIARLAAEFARQLKIILIEMTDTHGDHALMRELVDRNWLRLADVLDLFNSEQLIYWHESSGLLVRALAEYIRLGCYFPYPIIDAAISAEVGRHVDRRLKQAAADVLRNVQADLGVSFGLRHDWSALGFGDRLRVWNHLHAIDSQSLGMRWDHVDDAKRNREARQLLHGRSVPLRTDGGHVMLGALAPEYPHSCPYEEAICRPGPEVTSLINGARGKYIACQSDAIIGSDLTKGLGGATGTEPGMCAICYLSGAPHALVRSAAQRLKVHAGDDRLIDAEIGYVVGKADRLVQVRDCPIAVTDVDAMLAAFAAEGTRPAKDGEGPACLVTLYNGYRGKAQRIVLFAIWWRGETTPGSSSIDGQGGSATLQLANLKRNSRLAGRPMSWIGFWYKDAMEGIKISGDGMVNGAAIEDHSLFKAARKQFVESSYNFAYVCVFRIDEKFKGRENAA